MKKPTILVADDDPDILEAIRLILEIANYNVQVVAEGRNILKTLKHLKPDLLLLDVWMSGVSGIDVSKEIRQKKDIASIPILLISAGNTVQSNIRASGANGFIAKPFDMYELVKKIQQYLH